MQIKWYYPTAWCMYSRDGDWYAEEISKEDRRSTLYYRAKRVGIFDDILAIKAYVEEKC